MSHILIVDDNFQLTRLINLYLMREHNTSLVYNVRQAIQLINTKHFDLIVLDRILPDGDGLDLLKIIKRKRLLTPVLILSNKCHVEERVRGLREGADDYLGKPFSMEELLLKINKLLGFTKKINQHEINIGSLTIYEKEGKIMIHDREVIFRPREFEILLFLARHQNQVISRATLLEN